MMLPRPTADSAPYWTAAARGELCYQACDACSRAVFPPRRQCPVCGGPLDWRVASGGGVIHSWTRVERAPNAAFKAKVPYYLVLVDLVEGPRLMLNLRGVTDPGAVTIGAAVRIVFETTDETGVVLPQAELA